MKNVKIYGILSVYFPTLLAPTNIPKRPFVKIYRQFGLRWDTGSSAKVESRKANGRFPRRGEPSLANRTHRFAMPSPVWAEARGACTRVKTLGGRLALGFKPLVGGLPLRLNEGQHIYAESLPIGQHEIYQSQRSKARSLRLLPFWTPCAGSPLTSPQRGVGFPEGEREELKAPSAERTGLNPLGAGRPRSSPLVVYFRETAL